MKTHLNPTESLTVVIDGAEITLTAQQLIGLKQAETTDPDEKYRELRNELGATWYLKSNGFISKGCMSDFQTIPTQLSAQRVRTYIKMLNIAAKLNGKADWEGEGYALYSDDELICIGNLTTDFLDGTPRFKAHHLALEALTYLNSEDKIAMFGTDKVKE